MESNNGQSPAPANSSRASNSQRAGEVLTQDSSTRPNNQVLTSYHRIFPDGDRYVRVVHSPGFRFYPEDDELIVDFLNKEINKEQAEYIHVPKVNVYKHSPEELARSHQIMGKDEWYFFSPRERKYANGVRPNRAAGNGYWKATGADRKIYRGGECVGSKKCLVYYEGPAQNGDKTDWIMHEYVSKLPQGQRQGDDDMRLDDCVMCRIYKKSDQPPKTEKGSTGAASEGGETAKSAAHKSSKKKNQAAPAKRAKPENHGPNNQQLTIPGPHNGQQQQQQQQQLTLPGPQNGQQQQQQQQQQLTLPGPQNGQQQQQQQQIDTQLLQMIKYLQVRQPNPLTSHQMNLPVQQPNPQMPYHINLPGQQQNPNPRQITFPVQHPNPPTRHVYIPVQQPNPHPQMQHQINLAVPHPNPLTMHQNQQAIQYETFAGSLDHNLGGGMLDSHLGSVSEAHADIIQNNFTDYMVRNLTPPQIYPNGFPFPPENHDQTFSSHCLSPSTDSFNPDSLLCNNDQPDSDEQ